MKLFSNKIFALTIIFLSMSFYSIADGGYHKNNFRLEKRHYRKGFYFDCWVHPKTYPRTFTTPQTIERVEPIDRVEPVSNVPAEKTDTSSANVIIPTTKIIPVNTTNQEINVPDDKAIEINNSNDNQNAEPRNQNNPSRMNQNNNKDRARSVNAPNPPPVSAPVQINQDKGAQQPIPNN